MTTSRLHIGGWLALAILCLSLQPQAPAQAQGQLVLKIATPDARNSPWGMALQRFAEHVQQASEQRIHVRVFYDGILGGGPEAIARVSAGTLQAYAGPIDALYATAPALRAFELAPGPRSSAAIARTADTIDTLLKPSGLRVAYTQHYGARAFFSLSAPIQQADDLRAGPLAAPTHRVELLVAAGLPAISGSAERFEATLHDAVRQRARLPFKHVTLTKHGLVAGVLVYSERWFAGLPANAQQWLARLPREIAEPIGADVTALEERLIAAMPQLDAKVLVPSTAEAEAITAPLRRASDAMLRTLGEAGRALHRQLGSR